jgi:hypothetical protein
MHRLGLEDLPLASIPAGHLDQPRGSPLAISIPCRLEDLSDLDLAGPASRISPGWASILLGLSRSIQAPLGGLLGFLGLSPAKEKAPDLSGASPRLSGLVSIQA